jgi:hypothetical protein
LLYVGQHPEGRSPLCNWSLPISVLLPVTFSYPLTGLAVFLLQEHTARLEEYQAPLLIACLLVNANT